MRYGRLGAVLALFVFLTPAVASAATISDSHQVEVRAIVPANQFIIINDSGKITGIDSNSNKVVTPLVFKNTITQDKAAALTADIYRQYQQLTAGRIHAGIVYRTLSPNPTTSVKKLDLSSISSLPA